MSDLKDAVAKVQNLGALFRAVQVIADEVGKVSALEQLAGEANLRLSEKLAEEKDAIARVASANSTLSSANADLAKANKATADAKAKAKTLVSDAESSAASIVAEGTARASSIVADAETEKKAIETEISGKNKKLASINDAIADRSEALALLEKQIQDARDVIKQMVGGQ